MHFFFFFNSWGKGGGMRGGGLPQLPPFPFSFLLPFLFVLSSFLPQTRDFGIIYTTYISFWTKFVIKLTYLI